MLNWLHQYGIPDLTKLTAVKLELVVDFVESNIEAIDQHEASDQVRLLS